MGSKFWSCIFTGSLSRWVGLVRQLQENWRIWKIRILGIYFISLAIHWHGLKIFSPFHLNVLPHMMIANCFGYDLECPWKCTISAISGVFHYYSGYSIIWCPKMLKTPHKCLVMTGLKFVVNNFHCDFRRPSNC